MRKLIPLVALVVAGCVPRVEPPPAPAPAPRPAPTPAPAPAPMLGDDWRDWPLTPGDWTYRQQANASVSQFGVAGDAATLTLRCDFATRRIDLVRAGVAPGNPPMTITTTSMTRSVPTGPDASSRGMATTLAGNDPLLDAMGYSRGRFIIRQAGLPTLVVPAWPEIERVTEDCRK